MTNKEKIRFCNEISKIARIIFKDYDLCQITNKGCRRHTFEERKELCCIHCDHLKVGIGCKIHTISCSTGGCYSGWIDTDYITPEAIHFFGPDKIQILHILQRLRKTAIEVTGIDPRSRCSNAECFNKDINDIEHKRWKRYINGKDKYNDI